ncbi:MAG TPA: hypothetical protein VFJ91_11465, partial [Gaiellaceae bacterium]|nr:hypothetical protein [Gaiellaceae bacterium]
MGLAAALAFGGLALWATPAYADGTVTFTTVGTTTWTVPAGASTVTFEVYGAQGGTCAGGAGGLGGKAVVTVA